MVKKSSKLLSVAALISIFISICQRNQLFHVSHYLIYSPKNTEDNVFHCCISGLQRISGAETGNSYERKRTMVMGTFCNEDLRFPPFDESNTSPSEESHYEEQLSEVTTVPVGSFHQTPIHQITELICPGFYDECDELLDPTSSSSKSYSSPDHQMVASTEIGLSNLKLSLTAIGSKHQASDALMNDVLKVFRRVKPSSGLSGIKFKKDRILFLESTCTQVACKAGGLMKFDEGNLLSYLADLEETIT